MRKETRCHHIGYSFRLAARVLFYAPSHKQDSTYHDLRGALATETKKSVIPSVTVCAIDDQHNYAYTYSTELINKNCFTYLQEGTTSVMKSVSNMDGNFVFNDTRNTFYLQLYGIRHGKVPHRQWERKPDAATWDTIFD